MNFVRVANVEKAFFVFQRKLPPNIVVSAKGDVGTSGWTEPHLTPWYYVTPPADGIHDSDFVAKRPTGLVAQVVTDIEGTYVFHDVDIQNYWGNDQPLLGFRVHAANNSVVVMLGEAEGGGGNYTWL